VAACNEKHVVLEQAARALRDEELLGTFKQMQDRQLPWLKTRINQAAAQVLVVPV
jgi:hypothetical protein